MQALIDFINNFWESCKNFINWIFELLIPVLAKVFQFIMDIVFRVVKEFLSALDFGSYGLSYASHWLSLPDQLIYLLNACMVPQALTLLAGAYTLRFVLNLIPASFTRV
ncbi:MAG: hypothetical protein HZB31_06080 [Nitrospirae bacterium]|nr:hypothetical protein [Nitrospirota bacterium]